MSDYVYVIDTETSTTHWTEGVPDGHIVEIGVAKVNLAKLIVIPAWSFTVIDSSADPEAWVFKNTDLTYEEVQNGVAPEIVSAFLQTKLKGEEVTSYNITFDEMMLDRDLPYLNMDVRWGQDIMVQAAFISEIPKKHAGQNRYPTAEDSYNYLCPTDPCHLNGKEKHRALSDATMEAHILIELYLRGLWQPRGKKNE